ncbi:hypothetical protein HDV00_007893 [Rhizophlyctis rosea]|nr:hypothetical protein HDV00_007893 [Rhizophlyctis rosea]
MTPLSRERVVHPECEPLHLKKIAKRQEKKRGDTETKEKDKVAKGNRIDRKRVEELSRPKAREDSLIRPEGWEVVTAAVRENDGVKWKEVDQKFYRRMSIPRIRSVGDVKESSAASALGRRKSNWSRSDAREEGAVIAEVVERGGIESEEHQRKELERLERAIIGLGDMGGRIGESRVNQSVTAHEMDEVAGRNEVVQAPASSKFDSAVIREPAREDSAHQSRAPTAGQSGIKLQTEDAQAVEVGGKEVEEIQSAGVTEGSPSIQEAAEGNHSPDNAYAEGFGVISDVNEDHPPDTSQEASPDAKHAAGGRGPEVDTEGSIDSKGTKDKVVTSEVNEASISGTAEPMENQEITSSETAASVSQTATNVEARGPAQLMTPEFNANTSAHVRTHTKIPDV